MGMILPYDATEYCKCGHLYKDHLLTPDNLYKCHHGYLVELPSTNTVVYESCTCLTKIIDELPDTRLK